jgi:hypothetical protein
MQTNKQEIKHDVNFTILWLQKYLKK